MNSKRLLHALCDDIDGCTTWLSETTSSRRRMSFELIFSKFLKTCINLTFQLLYYWGIRFNHDGSLKRMPSLLSFLQLIHHVPVLYSFTDWK